MARIYYSTTDDLCQALMFQRSMFLRLHAHLFDATNMQT
jgi:hypothetical protein